MRRGLQKSLISIALSFRSAQGKAGGAGGWRGGFVFMCVWMCLNTSFVSQSLHLQEALLYSSSSSCKGEKTELCASFDVASAKCCQRETVVLEMKRGSIRLTSLTCVSCVFWPVIFFFFLYMPQVDELHNPSHLIQVHVLSYYHVDKSDVC